MILELFLRMFAGALMGLIVCVIWLTVFPRFTKCSVEWIYSKPRETLRSGVGYWFAFALSSVFIVSFSGMFVPFHIVSWIEVALVISSIVAAMAQGLTYLAAGRVVTDQWNETLIVATLVSAITLVVSPLIIIVTMMGLGGAISAYRHGDVETAE